MKRFEGLKRDIQNDPAHRRIIAEPPAATGTGKRAGLKTVAGHYSADLRKTLHRMALDENSSIQALLGEAIDLLLQNRGKHPLGER